VSVVAWHDVECGAYVADLPLWRALAAETGSAVLDVGAGTGRVALTLARSGVPVVAVDRDPALLAALRERAAGLPVETVCADARELALGRRFALAIVPMQTVQLLGGRPGRAAFLARAADHLEPGGRLAAALADPFEDYAESEAIVPRPDLGCDGPLVLCSQPTRVVEGPEGCTIERRRDAVAPDGERRVTFDSILIERVSPTELEAEAATAGFAPEPRRRVEPTADYIGSDVVVLRRG
jgi:SAM-dependent methyltransferase